MAAQFVTPEAINFMAKEARGWICLALTPERCDELGLELMTAKNESALQTPFTITIEARHGVTTGVSAHDRAHTMQVAVDPNERARRPHPAGARQPAEGQARRRARANRPHRGERRPRSPGRTGPGGRDLRGDERGRLDGARARSRRLLRAPRVEDGDDRRPDRLPPAQRPADRARRRDAAADDVRRLPGDRLPLDWSTTSTTSRSSRATSPARPTCSCACTRSA